MDGEEDWELISGRDFSKNLDVFRKTLQDALQSENSKLLTEIKNFWQLKELEDGLTNLAKENQIESLKKHMQDLAESLHKKQTEYETLKGDYEVMKSDYEKLEIQRRHTEAVLEKERDQLNEECNHLRKEKEEVQKAYKDLGREKVISDGEFLVLEEQLAKAIKENVETIKQNADLKEELNKSNAMIITFKKESDAAKNESEELKVRYLCLCDPSLEKIAGFRKSLPRARIQVWVFDDSGHPRSQYGFAKKESSPISPTPHKHRVWKHTNYVQVTRTKTSVYHHYFCKKHQFLSALLFLLQCLG